jgi:purine-binding chemotaxis protein CheW
MDFLKIRSKAKERAAARQPTAPGPPAADPPAADPPAAGPPAPSQAAQPAQPGPPAEAGQKRADDARFTTWKPGSGLRPSVEVSAPTPPPRPAPSDFAVLDPSRPHPAHELVAVVASAPGAGAPVLPAAVRPAAPAVHDLLDDFFYRPEEEVAALSGLPAEPSAPAVAGTEDAAVEEYLTFRLGHEEYAVAIEYVREVLKAPPITEVPRAPVGILGVVNVRGDVVGVFDPRYRLGLPAAEAVEGVGRIVIVDDGEGACGLLVDAVASVVRLPRGSVEPCPQGIGGASAECLAGIGRERSRLFTVLDLPALLRRGPVPERGGRREHGAA